MFRKKSILKYFAKFTVKHLIGVSFFYLKVFFNKHTTFHYIKIKLQQKNINKKKRYIRLKLKKKILNVKNQKNKTTTKTKRTITKTTTNPKEIHKDKKIIKKRPTPFF